MRRGINRKTQGDHASCVVQVAAGLILSEGRYLIARRKAEAYLGGLWEFPGGKREAGESLEGCLRRELREEIGVGITEPALFRVVRHDYPEKTVELHFFFCAIKDGQARALDCDEIRWVTPGELSNFDFPQADRPVVKALMQDRS
ncbi:MAG: 8-oxo-dGTP diphosphatase MutT [Nitrospirae bacterium]|nr:8-oxo-dGTP diphosphatase MutT [Nitrospirota bacterium]